MKLLNIIYSISLFILGFSIYSCKEQNSIHPNIVFIMSDDHAVRAISSYGSEINETPNIDRLANEGVKFNNAFVTNSICAPSRATLLTGKHSHMNGQMTNANVFDGQQNTFPKEFQKGGYETAIIGKWHLKSDPTGFDYWNILPGQGHYYNPDFNEMGEKKRHKGYVTDLTTKFSLDWLKNKRDEDKPFCLLIHHKAPHRNWMPGPEHLNAYDNVDFPVPETFFDDYTGRGSAAREQELEIDEVMYPSYDLKLTHKDTLDKMIADGFSNCFSRMDEQQFKNWMDAYIPDNKSFYEQDLSGKELAIWKYRRYLHDYLATINSVDESVGQVLDYLKENNLDENTIVVYTSDQGFYLGEHGWFDKRFMYEESFRTPLLIRYPNGRKGLNNDALVQNLDFAPSLLDFVGLPVPEDMQGLSLKPLLEGKEESIRDALYYHYYEFPAEHEVKRHYGIRTDRYKLIHFYYDVDEWELYDLENDPQELQNLIGEEKYQTLIKELKNRLEQLRKEYKVNLTEVETLPRIEKIKNLAYQKQVNFVKMPSVKYMNGENVLTDGQIRKLTPINLGDIDDWQAFEGEDLDVLVDLEKAVQAKSVEIHCLNNEDYWIFLPKSVEFEISSDGKNYSTLNNHKNLFSKQDNAEIWSYKAESKDSFRFLKIKAENFGAIPEGHPGVGVPAWLFVDEIIVKP